jgi:hypothetical protein
MQMTLGTALALLGGVVVLLIAAAWLVDGGRRAAPGARPRPACCRGSASSLASTPRTRSPPRPCPRCRTPPLRRPARLDALIDALVPLTLESPVSGEFVLSHLPPSRRAGTKVS